jgi:ribosomal protein S18 acetylase RimI-like enzyme
MGPSTKGIQSVEILRAGIEDEPAIVPLTAAFNRTEGIVWNPETMGAALRRLLREGDLGLILVARERASQAVVGYIMGTFGYDLEFAGPDAFITELFVEPLFRKRGLGRALLDAIIAQLRMSGANAVHLMVRPDNKGARCLYASRGFRVAPRLMMTKRFVCDDE